MRVFPTRWRTSLRGLRIRAALRTGWTRAAATAFAACCGTVAAQAPAPAPGERTVVAYTAMWSFEADAAFACGAELPGLAVPGVRNTAPGSVDALKELGALLQHTSNVLAMRCPKPPLVRADVDVGAGTVLVASLKADRSLALEALTPEGQRFVKAHADAVAYDRYRGHRPMVVVNPGGWGSTFETMSDENIMYRHMAMVRQMQVVGGACGVDPRAAAIRFAEEAARFGRAGKFDFALTYAKLALRAAGHGSDGRAFGATGNATTPCTSRLDVASQRSLAAEHLVPMLTDMALWAARAGRLDESQQAMTLLRVFRLALFEQAQMPMRDAEDGFGLSPYEVGMAEVWGLRGRPVPMPGSAGDLADRQAERGRRAPPRSIDPRLATSTTADGQRNRDDLRWLLQAGHRTVLLRYHVASAGVLAIAVMPDGSERSFELPVTRDALWKAVHGFRALLDPSVGAAHAEANLAELLKLARQLDDWLVAPLAPTVEAAQPHSVLMWAPDVLAYLPWGALHDGRQWLVERWPLATFDVDAIATVRRPPALPERVASFASAQGGVVDGRRLAALPKAADEVRRIRDLLGSSAGVFENERFTWRTFSSSVAEGRFDGIHIASHFVIRPENAGLSFFLLGDGTTMPIAALRQLDFSGTELVYLSACQTAMLPLSPASGDEVSTALMAFIKRGAGSAIGTLQAVDDEAAALLTRQFYAQLAQGRRRVGKADALRAAQLALLHGQAQGERQGWRGQPRLLSHPMYWAPFVIVGNWR